MEHEFDPADFAVNKDSQLAELLNRARADQEFIRRRPIGSPSVISKDWMRLASVLGNKQPRRQSMIYKEMEKPYEGQYIAAGAMLGYEPGFE